MGGFFVAHPQDDEQFHALELLEITLLLPFADLLIEGLAQHVLLAIFLLSGANDAACLPTSGGKALDRIAGVLLGDKLRCMPTPFAAQMVGQFVRSDRKQVALQRPRAIKIR